MRQYTYIRLRSQLRDAAATSPEVADVVRWRTDFAARDRIAADPARHVAAAVRALAGAKPDDIFGILSPCFQATMGPLQLNALVQEMTTASEPPDYRHLLKSLVATCEHLGISENILQPFKSALDGKDTPK